ncbi:MAG: DNA polymerase II large subunit [Candidatus Caldarchaeum sp.]|nr:DNA polymerase II large subunit [Candidatus Caldarchaeum sp.]
MNPELDEYRAGLLREVNKVYEVASEFRRRTNSPLPVVEPVFADRMEERVELLVGPKAISEKIRELKKKLSGIELAFKLCEEIVYANVGAASEEEVIHQAVCTSLAVLTPPCITAAPSEGISHVRIKENDDGSRYLAVYFAGPIRAAGGTELATVVVLADYVRRLFGLDRFKAREEEVKRFVEELRTYVRHVGRFQYDVPDKLIAYAYRMTPVEINGVATDEIPVPSFRDLDRVETNFLRGGALRVVNDGIVGRAKKVLKIVRSMGMSGWDWVEELADAGVSRGDEDEDKTLEVIGGRPVLSLSEKFGGFRIRYGRAFATGMAAYGIHPLTMKILKGYIVTGTQLKTDFPGKGGIVTPVDVIEPPVVKTGNGDVVKVVSEEVYRRVADEIAEILFLGDILVSVGDCVENNVGLRPAGYCEEWWRNDLAAKIAETGLKEIAAKTQVPETRLKLFVERPFTVKPSAEEALALSRNAGVPLHPRYLHFWTNISAEQASLLARWIAGRSEAVHGKHILPHDVDVKKTLEMLLVEHQHRGNIILNDDDYLVLSALLKPGISPEDGEDVLSFLRRVSGIDVRDKRGSSLTARMGRPEKAGARRTSPAVNFLFPVGLAGGATRNVVDAAERTGVVAVEVAVRRCPGCGAVGWREFCENCGTATALHGTCRKCRKTFSVFVEECDKCGAEVGYSAVQRIDLRQELASALQKIGEAAPSRVSGVKGLTSRAKVPEAFLKGVLRAKHGLFVYKDGTIRFDVTNAPLTHFKPRQINVCVEKLRQLGYFHDVKGDPIVSTEQTVELMPQDIVVSRKAAEHLLKVSRYIDDLLLHAGMQKLYNLKTVEDLVGQIVVGLSPHTYVAVVARIIGFVDAEVNFAHPVLHAAKRRDCDGDEDSVMLLADVLMNFSRLYIPDRIGGKMDTPLLITRIVYPEEVDEQAHNVDVWDMIPNEFYAMASEGAKIAECRNFVRILGDDLAAGTEGTGAMYTHPQTDIAVPGIVSAYKSLETMMEKIGGQLELMQNIAAVRDAGLVDNIVSSHILPDIIGNVKAFMIQSFRCKKCNRKFRRLPLTGKCPNCQLDLTLTVFRGNVEKYIDLAKQMAENHLRNPYLIERTLSAVENVVDLFTPSKKPVDKTVQTRLEAFLSNEP